MFDVANPTTELEAVNLMLASIGEQPTPTLTRSQSNADIQAALMSLRATTRSVQKRGWAFNMDLSVRLNRDPTLQIILPINTVRTIPDRSDPTMCDVSFVERAGKLYDTKNNTFLWQQDLVVHRTFTMPFQEMPEAARNYCHVMAARRFQSGFETSQILHRYIQEDEIQALTDMTDYEVETSNPNMLNDSTVVANLWSER